MRGIGRKISWKKRMLSLLLAVTMIAGNISQTAYGAENVRTENSKSRNYQKVIKITEKEIQKILDKDPDRRPEVKLSDIPFKGDAKKQSILDEVLSMTQDKVLVKKAKDGDAVCLIFVERANPDFAYEDEDAEEMAFADYLEIITINGGKKDVDFKVELVSGSVIFEEVTESRFQVVGENEDFILATPSEAGKAEVEETEETEDTATPSEAQKGSDAAEENEQQTEDSAQQPETDEAGQDTEESNKPENGGAGQDTEESNKPENGGTDQDTEQSTKPENGGAGQDTEQSTKPENGGTGQESDKSTRPQNGGEGQKSEESQKQESSQGRQDSAGKPSAEKEDQGAEEGRKPEEAQEAGKKTEDSGRADKTKFQEKEKKEDQGGDAVASRSLRPKYFVTSVDDEEEAGLINLTFEEDITEEFQESLVEEGGIVINDVGESMLKVTRIRMAAKSSIINWAQQEEYFGDPEDPEDNAIRVGKSLLEVKTPDGEDGADGELIPVGAGQDFQLILNYKIENGPPYFDAMGKSVSLYKAQDLVNENAVAIRLHVPADLVIKELGTPETDPEDGHWIYAMNAADVEGRETLNAYFAGNGETPLNTLYSLTDQTATEVVGEFTVTDEETEESLSFVFQDWGDPGLSGDDEPVTYEWTIQSDDKWTVYNENVNAYGQGQPVTIEKGAYEGENAILFEYDVVVALGEGNHPEKAEEVYFKFGRAAFESYELQETVTLWEMKDGVAAETDIVPMYMELIPEGGDDYRGSSNDGGSWRMEAGDDTATLTTSQYGVRGYINTGGTELDTTADTAPYYTSYKVKAYYEPRHFGLDYHDPRANAEQVFQVRNTSRLIYGYTGADGNEAPETHEAEGYYQYVNEGAQITVKKYLEIPRMKGGSLDTVKLLYGADLPEEMQEAYGGEVRFRIERKVGEDGDDYELYENAQILHQEEFKPLEDLSISSDSDGALTFFVEPGTYRITEVDYPEKLIPVEGEGNGAVITETQGGKHEAAVSSIEVRTDSPVQVEFYNEVNSGGIYFEKQGYIYENHETTGRTEAVEGVTFGLFESSGADKPIATAESDENGAVTFFPVDLSDSPYVLKELRAPEGYLPDAKEYEVTIKRGELATPEFEGSQVPVIYNNPNRDVVTVTKYIDRDPGQKDGSGIEGLPSGLSGDFKDSFRIQYQMEDGAWADCGEGTYSLEETGSFRCDLPVFYGGKGETDSTPTSYRVVETLPSNYTSGNYDIAGDNIPFSQTYDETEREVTSAPFEMRLDKAAEEPREIPIVNILKGTLSLEKYHAQYGAVQEGTSARVTAAVAGAEEAVFYLLKEENGALIQAGGAYATDEGGVITGADLDVWNGAGEKIDYFWYEAPVPGTKLEVYRKNYEEAGRGGSLMGYKGNFTIDGIGLVENAQVAGPFQLEAGEDIRAYAYNVDQKIPVWFIKEARKDGALAVFGNSQILRNETDPDTWFHFTVYRESEGIVENEACLEAVNRSEPYYLEPGFKYRVIENEHPDRYMGYEGSQDKTMEIGGKTYYYQELDLTGAGGVDMSSPELKENSKNNRIVFVNEEKQKFKLIKTVFSGFDSEGNISVTEERPQIHMRLYKADGAGTADTSSFIEIEAQKEVWVEPGTYFITEPNPPAGCVNPAFYLQDRSAQDNKNDSQGLRYYIDKGGTENDKTDDVVYFGPYEINRKLSERDDLVEVEITNYKALGSVKATKLDTSKTPEQNNRLKDAVMGLYRVNGPEKLSPVKDPATGRHYQVTTGDDGLAVFGNLNVYDDKGQLITYIIKEDKAPAGYDLDQSQFSFQLTPGVPVTEGRKSAESGNEPIVFYDNPLGTIVVQKFWYDRWAQQFNYDYSKNELPGVNLALFEAKPDGGDVITANYVKTLPTAQGDAAVIFRELDRTHVYFVVEMDSPKGYMLPDGLIPLPEDVKELTVEKTVDNQGNDTYQLTDPYNYAVFNPQKETDPALQRKAEILNQRPWVQINLTKYADRELSKLNSQWEHQVNWDGENYYYQEIPEDARTEMNGARFNLYQIPAEAAGADLSGIGELAKENPQYLVDTYETGTKLDAGGAQMAGQFMTAILRDGYIYYLEEVKPGIGGEMLDRPQNMVFVPEDVNSYSHDGFEEGVSLFRYHLNQVTAVNAFNYKWADGEGEGGIYTAYVKLNKWLEQKDGTTIPLGGVTYELRVGSQLIATLETGLDNEWNPEDDITGQAMSNLLYYEEILKKLTPQEKLEYVNEELHSIKFQLVEVKAPDRVNMAQEPYELEVTFTEGGMVQEEYFWLGQDNPDNEGRTQLINTLMEGYHAEVNVFGYVPTDEMFEAHEDTGLTDTILHGMDDLDAVRLEEVEMELYKYNYSTGEYEPYNFDGSDNRFRSDNQGNYKFPNGLPQGKYYIIETKIPYTVEDENGDEFDKYFTMYNQDPMSGGRYVLQKRFTVSASQDNTVNIYNPERPSLKVTKEAYSGEQVDLKGLSFTLKCKDGKEPQRTAAITRDGQNSVIFKGIRPKGFNDSNKYVITENAKNNANVSDKYQDKESLTVAIGYQRFYDANKEEVSINRIQDSLPLTNGEGDYVTELTIRNPQKSALVLAKADGEDETPLNGATFSYDYLKFRDSDYSEGTDGRYVKYSGTATPEIIEEAELGSRQWKGTRVGITKPTGPDGTVTILNLDPGWYRIVENSAPAGYHKDTTPYYVAVPGDMGEGNQYQETITMQPIPNRKLVKLSVTKNLDYGSLSSSAAPDSVTFTLYKGTSPAEAQPVKNAKNKELKATVTFSGSAGTGTIEGIPQLTEAEWNGNLRYYLKEETTPAKDWMLMLAQDNNGAEGGSELTIYPGGMIELPRITTKTPVDITVTNRYAKAEFTFKKVEAGNESLALNGAEFALYTEKAGEGQLPGADKKVAEAVVTNPADEAGVYTITNIPVTNPEGSVYYLYEIKTPATYYVPPTEPLEITVKPGEKLTFSSQADDPNPWIITNESGVDISLVKHPDVYGGPRADEIQKESVTFTLYVRDITGAVPGPWSQVGEPQTPEESSGRMTWRGCKLAGREYALHEQEITQGVYKNYVLDGIYLGDQEAVTGTDTLESGRTIYVLGQMDAAGREYEFHAYNKPAAQLVIQKKNIEGLEGNAPEATFRILDSSGTETLEDNIVTRAAEGKEGDYTEARVPLKEGAYILEEIQTGEGYSLIKDDERVITRRSVQIPDSSNPEQTYTFTNAKADPDLTLEKEVATVNGEAAGGRPVVENLWWNDGQTIGYDITPQLKENHIGKGGNFAPVREFILTDEGLSMLEGKSEGKELSYDLYVRDNYTFTSVTIPRPVHESFLRDENGGRLAAGPITAELTFYDFDGAKTGDPQIHEFGQETEWKPELPSGINVKGFAIRYYDQALKDATGGKYSLGQNFQPGTIQAEVILHQMTYRAEAGDVVGTIRNSVNASAEYVIYNRNGDMGFKKAGGSSQADVEVLNPDIPTISINLDVANKDKPQAGSKVSIGDTLRYTMGLENVSGQEIKSSMIAPILVNRFPKGVVPDLAALAVTVNGEPVEPDSAFINTEEDGFTYLLITLKDTTLERGGTVSAVIDTEVTNAIINNGDSTDIRNYLYVTSGLVRDPFGLNPGGASYKWKESDEPKWPDYSSISGTDVIDRIVRENNLYKGSQNGYAHVSRQNEYSAASSVTVLKEGHGNLDAQGIYVSEPVSAKMSTADGSVTYRLINKNTSSGNTEITKLRVLDMIPIQGDKDFRGYDRGSRWDIVLDTTFEPVLWRMDAGGNRVDASETNAVIERQYYLTNADELDNSVLNKYEAEPGSPWIRADVWEEAGDAQAALFDIRLEEPLKRNESIVVEFRAKASGNLTEAQLKDLAYTYDNNNFSMRYYYKENPQAKEQMSKDVLTSNLVSVNLQPQRTGVGGRIWIDANGNGIQDDDQYADETRMNSDLKELIESGYFDISLGWTSKDGKNVTGGAVGAAQGELPDIPADSLNRKGVVSPEGRFLFYGLYSSVPDKNTSGDSRLYKTQEGNDEFNTIWNKLVKDSLYSPYTWYQLKIHTSEMMPDSLKGMILEGAKTGMKDGGRTVNKDNGKSRKPSELSGKYSDETKDNNFTNQGTGSFFSEDFFLWTDGDNWDLTKDFGVVPRRNLTLTKKDEDGAILKGARFALYGPFDNTQEAKDFDIQSPGARDRLVESLVTDEKGQITFQSLLYYLPYVLVEEDTPDDYMLRGATVSPGNVQPKTKDPGEAAWILHYGVDEVTVTNKFGAGDLNLVKVDADTKKELAGAVFILRSQTKGFVKLKSGSFEGYTQKPEEATAVTTDNTGKVTIKNLPWDIYQVIETKAPEGYLINGSMGWIEMKEGASFTFQVENKKADNGGEDPGDNPGGNPDKDPGENPIIRPGGSDGSGSSGGSGGGGGGGGSITTTTTTTINPEPVPLAMLPPPPTSEITILEEDVPLAPLPKTGETVSMTAGLTALISSALMGIYLAVHKKKKPES